MTATALDCFEDRSGPPGRPEPGEIHVWLLDLEPPACLLERLRRLLSADEIERAHSFRFEIHRRRYVARRGAMRWLLGRYLGRDPARLRFVYGERGKPAVDPAQDPENDPARRLQLNLSDSEDVALCAFGAGQELGVDVEMRREMPDAESIAEHFFANSERLDLRRLAAEHEARGFFNCWTRKEAYLKAIGEGLAQPLDSFQVTLSPDEPARFVSFLHDADEADRWSLFHLEPVEARRQGWVGALAIRRHGCRLRGFRWRPDPAA